MAVLNGWTVVAEYLETVSGGAADRVEFSNLMAAAARKEFDVVCVWSLDRFGRQGTLATLQHLNLLEQHGVGFKSLQEPFLDSTDSNPFREVFVSMMSCFAKQERLRIAERIRAGIARSKAGGKVFGRAPISVDLDRLASLRAAGLSRRACARSLGVGATSLRRLEHRLERTAHAQK